MPSYLNLLAFSLLIFRVDDPSASDISAAIEKDGSITKACDVASQATTTLDNGRLPLSVIYYGHKNYFFNSSRVANIVSRPTVSPKLCPKTFHDIFSTCVIDQNIWGGWVMSESTNRSSKSPLLVSYTFRLAQYTEHSIPRSPSSSNCHVGARYWMYFAIS